MTAFDAYKDLEQRFKNISILGEAMSVLHWDAAVMMPPGGAEARGEQLAALQVMSHQMLTDSALGDLLERAGEADLDGWQRANLREMKRLYLRSSCLPEDMVAAFSKACSACEHKWREARENADFDAVRPLLEEVLTLARRRGEIFSEALNLPLYDALIDGFEPGGSTERIGAIFDDYAAFLPDFLQAVLDKQGASGAKPQLHGPFDRSTQKALAEHLSRTVGFDFERGRMDESAHPFSTGFPGDHRITVSYDEKDPGFALMAALHETGHTLYEQNLPAAWHGQPVGSARGMALHESQSLMVEMQACRSPEFIAFVAPLLREAFGDQPAFEDASIRRLYHWVEPDFIRVDADEVTYPAHVIVRFRLEQALLGGDLSLKDLPGAWNAGMRDLLGITPPNDRVGCLQDIHWYDGAFGYFPTYTLGAMTAAQLFQAATEADGSIRPGLAQGDFTPLVAWLRANVHGLGSSLSSDEIVERATGRPLDPASFERHLRARYLDG